MIWGGIATLVGLVARPLGQAVGWVAWVFLTYTIGVVRLTARVPFASVPVRMEGWIVWGYYALLAGLTWWLAQPPERRRELRVDLWSRLSSRVETKALAGAVGVLLVLGFFAWRGLPDGRLHVAFLDVGQGTPSLSRPPRDGRCWWIVGRARRRLSHLYLAQIDEKFQVLGLFRGIAGHDRPHSC